MLVAFFVYCTHVNVNAQEQYAQLKTAGTTMGVVSYSVTAYGDSDLQAGFSAAVLQELESVNQRMSTYIPESDVSLFNATNSTEWISVTRETAVVVEKALEISELSDGAFDITVQPLVEMWSFSARESETFGVPDESEVKEVLKRVGYQKLQVRLDPPSLRKSRDNLQIDLSAIAKGYAVDMVNDRLMAMGFDDFLIEVGGEVRVSGDKLDNEAWKVGIEQPIEGVRIPYRVIELYHKSLASSGDYRNFYEIDGKRYSHTIDPRTGFPVDHNVAAASVIASDCMTADALATAIMVLGKEAGIELAQATGVEALILERSGNQFLATETSKFPKSTTQNARPVNSIFRIIAIASFFFLFAMVAMAIGVIFRRDGIKGSCGGIAALDNPDVSPECSLCSRAAECDDLKKEMKKRGGEA